MPKYSGKSGSVTYNNTNTALTITQWTASTNITTADTTGSDCYDVTNNLVWKQQVPASAQIEISVEGPWNPTDGNTQLLAQYTNNAAGNATANCTLIVATNTTFFSGPVSVTSFELTTPIEDTVTYTATLMSYGKPTIS